MISKVNFDARPILQLFVIAVRAINQLHNRKIKKKKKGSACKFTL